MSVKNADELNSIAAPYRRANITDDRGMVAYDILPTVCVYTAAPML